MNERFRSTLLKIFSKPRIIKTGISVFITAWLCKLLGWPVIFAVIAAIVSVEPTVNQSIQKGKVRLPAAAVGAFFAMLLNFVLGPIPLTYSLSAVLTIYVCHLLRWHEALVVATLTAVNMIEVVDGHWLLDFFVRLGTTSIGIVVSTCINFLIFPPRFSDEIVTKSTDLHVRTKELLNDVIHYLLYQQGQVCILESVLSQNFAQMKELKELIHFQKEENRHRLHKKDKFEILEKYEYKLRGYKMINYQLADMVMLPSRFMNEDQNRLILRRFERIRARLLQAYELNHASGKYIDQCISELTSILHMEWEIPSKEDDRHPALVSVVYDLLAICFIIRNTVVKHGSI